MDEDDPVARLTAFVDAMHRWEVAAHDTVWAAQDGAQERLRAALDAVFAEHCTPRRRRGRRAGLRAVHPPDYDVATQPVLDVARRGRRAQVWTARTDGLHTRYRYTLVLTGVGWRVDRREMYDGLDERWVPDDL